MFCTKCGSENKPETKFCIHCGAPMYQAPAPVQEPAPVPPVEAYSQPQPAVVAPVCPPAEEKPKKSGKTSLILGIISLVTSIWIVISLPLSIIGLILGVKSDRNSKSRKWGIATNAAALGMSLISIVLVVVLVIVAMVGSVGETTFYGDGYELTYNSDWQYDAEQEVLIYEDGEVILNEPETYTIEQFKDFSWDDEQQMNNLYYALWENFSRAYMSDDITVWNNQNSYNEIQEGVYCFYYEYTPMFDADGNFIKEYDYVIHGGDHGAFILILCPEKNVGYTFEATFEGDMTEGSEIVLDLLFDIEIQDPYAQNGDATADVAAR
ncbi:MAG: zinc-ribbon domain-containing protein [Clostridia bacterium]|nr:zinc-ribbon domain-containing protein [Clostridia bacterium]